LGMILTRDYSVYGALITIMGVDVSDDLLQARVRIAIIPYEKGPEIFETLKNDQGIIQHRLLKKMNIKPMPHIRFEIDVPTSLEAPIEEPTEE